MSCFIVLKVTEMQSTFLFKKKQLLLLGKICHMQLVENDGRLNVNWRNGYASSEVAATLILSTTIKFTLIQLSECLPIIIVFILA